MTPYAAALDVLTAGPLTRRRLRAAGRAALDTSSARFPILTDVEVRLDTRSRKRLGGLRFLNDVPFEMVIGTAAAAVVPVEEIADTIAHEVAHAIAGHEAGHGARWKTVAREVGAAPRRCSTAEEIDDTMRYVGVCVECHEVLIRWASKPRTRRHCLTHREENLVVIDLRSVSLVSNLSRVNVPADRVDPLRTLVRENAEAYREANEKITTLARTS